MIYAGQTLVWGLKTYDAAGALADVGTGPTATVTRPDGTTGSATVTKTATGTYSATFASTIVGRYTVVWSGSGVNSGGLPYSDVRDVQAAAALIISLADARASLNLPAGSVANDSELLDYIAAATEVIEDLAGPQLSATVVETRSGGGARSLLLHQRATAITSVVEDGTTLSATDYALDTSAGILWRGSTPGAAAWAAGADNIVVTYTVGGGTIAPNVLLAARELVRHLYSVGQQSTRPVFGTVADQSVDMGYTPAGFAVPTRVVELLRPSMANRMPGIA